MGLTPEEEAELKQLEAGLSQMDEEEQGNAAVDAVDRQRLKPTKTEGFSLWRSGVGAVRDAAQGVIDTVDDTGDFLQRKMPLPSLVFGSSADNGIIGIRSAEETTKATEAKLFELPHLAGEENAGGLERFTRTVGSYMLPFVGWAKALGVFRAETLLGTVGRSAAAGFATDFLTDPADSNLATTIRDTFGIHSDLLDSLAYEDDDERLWSRFKAAAVNAPIGIAADALLETGFKALKAYRAWKGSFEDANAAVKAAEAALPIQRIADEAVSGEAAAKAAGAGAKRAEKEAVDETMRVKPDEQPEGWEDILSFLQRKAGLSDQDVDVELLSRFAHNLVVGNPENALAKMGIDPSKLDYSMFDDPDMLGRIQRGLAEIYEGIASKLGRTGIRVTEEATHMAARAMATTADVLKDLYGNTANLAETMMAARLFVGSHAHKLLSEAEKALAAIKAGDGTAEWSQFLESFYRHAYFLGALRGAGSEVARALRGLQFVTKAGRDTRKGVMEGAVEAERKAQQKDAGEVAKAALDSLASMEDPAEKLLLLGKVLKAEGDIGQLSELTRARVGSTLHRLDKATKETLGNLFSQATGIMNAKSGLAMMGLRSLAKGVSALTRMIALAPFSRSQAVKARVALMDAWAYTDGILSGFRQAVGNTVALLEREGMAEVALNADNLGLKKLAAKAASMSAEGTAAMRGGNFERVDIEAGERAFVLSAADRRELGKQIESWGGPQLFQHAMTFLVRTVGGAINAAGSLARSGTILWINAPDQLIGTLAMRAGAQAEAVRMAARTAAELRLEGPELSKFLKAKVAQLTSQVPDGFDPEDSFLAGQREAARIAGEHEAREILFQDDPEFAFSRAMANAHINIPFAHIPIAFLKTPLRILERTAIDFTPLGLLKDRTRRALLEGGPARDEALARVGLGTLMMASAYQMAADRQIVGKDGSYGSSARVAGRPSYSLIIGGDSYEFLRDDPLGTLLGLGADMHAYLEDQDYNPEASGKVMQMFEAGVWSTWSNIMSKTWLTSLKSLTELAGVDDEEEFSTRLRKYLNTYATRIVPAAGSQRALERIYDPFVRDAQTFSEALLKASVGANQLPIKRDQLLGRPTGFGESERLAGIKYGPIGPLADGDPLMRELEMLAFNVPAAKKTLKGVKLDSTQFNRWLELRGQVVRSGATGLTLEESLRELIKLPEYQELGKHGRIQAMRDEMDGFAKLATQALIEEDPKFAKAVLKSEVYEEGKLAGTDRRQLDAETERFARELGLMQ